ncbi:MAG: dihydroorotate dehydrogenase electron transfer subunit, partial [Candidatus Omnitrophica bacterium]|nr:dihydroorotate dehydrogenase electron transfer subunit [Candidatus Omnitrophota bacterium]
AGEYLNVIGPLGNGFDICGTKPAILVAGGVGAAPLLALAEKLRAQNIEVNVLIGASKKSHVLCEREFKKLGCKVSVSTDDGSAGRKGFVTDLLSILLTTYNLSLTTIYACGPNAMLKEVARIAGKRGVPCQVSLEERMACGVGVCLGCPVKIKNSKFVYKMVCKDGPIFDAKEIAW